MPQISGHKFSIKGKIFNREGRLWFHYDGIEFFLLPGVLKNIPDTNFEVVEAEIKGLVSFEAKSKKDSVRTVILKPSEELKPLDMELDIPSLNINLSQVNLVAYQGASFQEALLKAISEDLTLEQFDEIFDQERIPWSDEEEALALDIYLKSQNGQDSSKMKELIEENITNGTISRAFNAVKMKVYQYQSVDRDVTVDGLGNISKKTIETLRRYKESLNTSSEE